ncbi:MAG: hypothetical protein OXR84_02220, partial [Magnetovibrio sp.]|nr:hypothetical protein [Magnetovibrio sp.]
MKFGAPPRKPPAPMAEATEVAEAPGLKSGEEGLPPAAEDSGPKSATAAKAKDQGLVGKFFQTLLDLVRPDAPATPAPKAPKPAAPSEVAEKSGAAPSQEEAVLPDQGEAALPDQGEGPVGKDESDLADLLKEDGKENLEAAEPELPPASDDAAEKTEDADLAELERLIENEP